MVFGYGNGSDGRAISGNFQSHRSHSILKPALRVNNGMALDLDSESQGFANRVRRVPNGILPPSSTGNLEKDGLKNPGGTHSVQRGFGRIATSVTVCSSSCYGLA